MEFDPESSLGISISRKEVTEEIKEIKGTFKKIFPMVSSFGNTIGVIQFKFPDTDSQVEPDLVYNLTKRITKIIELMLLSLHTTPSVGPDEENQPIGTQIY